MHFLICLLFMGFLINELIKGIKADIKKELRNGQ